jgi:hypothetical protein
MQYAGTEACFTVTATIKGFHDEASSQEHVHRETKRHHNMRD